MGSKRDREKNIQGWFDDEDAEEKAVIDAFNFLRDKYPALAPKWILGNALIHAAESEGFDPKTNPSNGFDNRVDELLQQISRLTAMLQTGSFVPMGAAAGYADEDTVQIDAISASVGNLYRPLSFEDDE